MAKNNEMKSADVTELEHKLLVAHDEITLVKSYFLALTSENDLLLSSNKRLHAENSKLKQCITALEEELKKFTDSAQ